MRQARDESALDRVRHRKEEDWDICRRLLGSNSRLSRDSDEEIRSGRCQLGGQNPETLRFLVREAVIERHRLAIDISNFTETLDKGTQGYLFLFGVPGMPENANARNSSLLRNCSARDHHPAGCGNKVASPHVTLRSTQMAPH